MHCTGSTTNQSKSGFESLGRSRKDFRGVDGPRCVQGAMLTYRSRDGSRLRCMASADKARRGRKTGHTKSNAAARQALGSGAILLR